MSTKSRPGLSWRLTSRLSDGSRYILALAFVLASLFPILYMVLTSLKTPIDSFALPPKWAFTPTLENYTAALGTRRFSTFLVNSLVTALSSTVLSVGIGFVAAYSLARLRYRGRGLITKSIIITRMIPPIGVLVPVYVLWQQLHLTDTRLGLILLYTAINIPFAVWVLRDFILSVPAELEDAAMVDGCTRLGVCFRIVLPLAAPGLVATSIFCLRIAWNDFLFALVLTGTQARTLPVAVSTAVTDYAVLWGQLTAMGTVVVLPMLIFTLLVTRYLLVGLTAGAVKQ